jgi:ribose/xylose/arabinose/galactoside ABC-type transport system permease subunit
VTLAARNTFVCEGPTQPCADHGTAVAYGAVVDSVIGAIFIGIVQFGLLTNGYSTSIQEVIKGAIIVVAVTLNRR